MARPPRCLTIGQPQHVIQRGNNRSATFATEAHYWFFRDSVGEACERYACHLHAYVFMPNHVHLLISPHAPGAIGKVMQSVGRRYVRYFNDNVGRTGTLWEGRYRAAVVDSDRYLLTCYRYIELNPVRAGNVANPADYRWSSYRRNAFGVSDPLVVPHDRYQALALDARARESAYRALFQDALDDTELREIREATNKGRAVGAGRSRRWKSRRPRLLEEHGISVAGRGPVASEPSLTPFGRV